MDTLTTKPTHEKTGLQALLAGGLAVLLASSCCIGPLVLIALGVSGAWISNLAVLTPFQPVFIGAALLALFFAGKRIWRPAAQCAPGEACALPQVKLAYQVLYLVVCALLLAVLGFPFIAHWFY
ncbi:MAG: mercuric ion transporter MerT [Burkholderiaceae bacterium]